MYEASLDGLGAQSSSAVCLGVVPVDLRQHRQFLCCLSHASKTTTHRVRLVSIAHPRYYPRRSCELEAMIDADMIEALPTGYTRPIPTREVERLKR